MNLLLDTQLVLWTAFWPNKIPRQAAEAIKRASTVHISSVSVFEIALKASIGKLDIPFGEFEVRLATSSGAERLSLTWEHACRVLRYCNRACRPVRPPTARAGDRRAALPAQRFRGERSMFGQGFAACRYRNSTKALLCRTVRANSGARPRMSRRCRRGRRLHG